MMDYYDINEALKLLKEGILLKDNKTIFVFKNNKFCCYFDGSLVKINEEDFIELYKNDNFYIFEDKEIIIDETKDEDYYRYYKK